MLKLNEEERTCKIIKQLNEKNLEILVNNNNNNSNLQILFLIQIYLYIIHYI